MMDDPFQFTKEIGSGGFGKVWLAVDRGLNAECVVKRIPPEKIINQSNFFDEAQILKKAEHPNIVKVHGTGKLSNGDIYISMEYLKKGSLEAATKKGYVPLRKAVTLMIDILRGLEHAHSKAIIHRDIKPANILIGESLEGKLSDFGLAVCDIANLKSDSFQSHKYRTHLAPEVRKLTDYSVVSDIYACGVTLYRLINGDDYIKDVPFDRIKELAEEGKFPDRNRYREFIPRSLRTIINKSLDVKPSQRYKTAEELRRVLEKVKVLVNWDEQDIFNGKRWTFGSDKGCCEVTRVLSKNSLWDVSLKKGKTKKTLRCVGQHCFKNLKEKEAIRQVSKILQSFVNGTIQ